MKLKHLLPFIFIFSCFQVHAIAYRIKSMAHLTYTGIHFDLVDTTNYTYSGTHTSNLNTGVIQFDSSFRWEYTAGALTPNMKWRSGQTFDANNNIQVTITQYLDTATGNWINYSQTYFNYVTGTNNISTQTVSVWNTTNTSWVGSTQSIYTYNGNNILAQVSQLFDVPSNSFVNYTKDSFIYNTVNTDSVKITYSWNTASNTWVNATRYEHYININNLPLFTVYRTWSPVISAWTNSTRIYYGFNPTNQETWERTENWKNSAWKFYSIDSFYYTGTAGPKNRTLTQLWDTFYVAFKNSADTVYLFDASNNLTNKTYRLWYPSANTFVNNTQEVFTYDVNNNVTSYQTQAWDLGSNQWKFLPGQNADVWYRYHYEQYTTGVQQHEDPYFSFSIFPNPTNRYLNVNIKWKEQQDFTIAIFDLQGRLWKQWGEHAASEYEHVTFVDDLPTGNYFIQVIGTNNERFSKQFVVAH